MKSLLRSTLALFALTPLLATPTVAQDPVRKSIYDKDADAVEMVDKALVAAHRANGRVLAMIGGDWCGWCHLLHGVFESNEEIHGVLDAQYEVVMLDSKAKGMDELVKRWGSKVTGYPFLVVLASDGSVVRNQPTDPLEEGDHHDPEKVLAFLEQHKVPQLDARTVLDEALAEAKSSGRKVFVHLGAPWCGWCHKLEVFLARPDIAERLAEDIVEVKIDQDTMENGKEVAAEIRKGRGSGIPWSVLLAADGTEIITSDADGPGKGNVGFPVQPQEIAHFMTMLEAVRENMTDEDMAAIRKALSPPEKKAGEEAPGERPSVPALPIRTPGGGGGR